jgi:hypothetical protein
MILLKSEFIHYLDIPALSMIVPILDYGLRSRDDESKEDAARIVATISNLIKDPKDFVPYINTLVDALLISIMDNLADVRSLAAKALGNLGEKLGSEHGVLFHILKF